MRENDPMHCLGRTMSKKERRRALREPRMSSKAIAADASTLEVKELAQVNYPIAKARGLQLRRIAVTPAGAFMPTHPYRVLIRRLVDCQSGAGHRGPSLRQRHPLSPR